MPGPAVVDRRRAGIAMALAPMVGLGLGGLAALAAKLPGLIGPVAAVAVLAATTRGLHLDGLADTADGLGTHDRERALAVMKQGDVGPFGVVVVVLVLLGDVAGVSAGRPSDLLLAGVVSRLAVTIGCTRGVPAARPDGLGSLVAGTVPRTVTAALTLAVVGAGFAFDRGPIAVLAAILVAVVLLAHSVRRLGGITGDVLGAMVEAGLLTTLLVVR